MNCHADCLAAPPVDPGGGAEGIESAGGAGAAEGGEGDAATHLARLPPDLLEKIDRLVDAEAGRDVQIGEMLDGRVLTRGLSTHAFSSRKGLEGLIAVAKSRRATAPTERNATSSRSHGVGILSIGQPGVSADDPEAPRPGVCSLSSTDL